MKQYREFRKWFNQVDFHIPNNKGTETPSGASSCGGGCGNCGSCGNWMHETSGKLTYIKNSHVTEGRITHK